MPDLVARTLARPRALSGLVIAFGGLALALSVMGVYAVMAWAVAERRQEMAVRLAIGATSADIRRMVIVRSITLAGIGLVGGVAISFLAGAAIRSLTSGVGPIDAAVVSTVVVVVVAAALAGAALPAIRAGRIRPGEALRG